MCVQRFDVRIGTGARGHALIVVPFDPDAEWGVKAVHHVSGTVSGCRVRVTLAPGASGWAFTMNPTRMQHAGIVVGSQVPVELSPEGPQRGELAEDIAAALEANPAAGAFFDTLAQFYRNGCLRYIDATKRRPDLRTARIAEVSGRPGPAACRCWMRERCRLSGPPPPGAGRGRAGLRLAARPDCRPASCGPSPGW